MGITADEMIQRMYAKSTSGDWSEFGEEAQKLKWVNHIVRGIDESSFIEDPDKVTAPTSAPMPTRTASLTEEIDPSGKPYVWLPRLDPKDVYFLYNPDSYYRMR
jgi:ATP-dependent Clp protease protease subunit